MPFLDSKTIRPLYDVHEGGPPKAFLCVYLRFAMSESLHCNAVTKTYAGMIHHLRYKHGVVIQPEMAFEEIKPTEIQ